MTNQHLPEDRRIAIQHGVVGSAIISGDGNQVFITYNDYRERTDFEDSSLANEIRPNPYRGLATFQIEDADVYFGRETQVDRLIERLQNLFSKQGQHAPIRILPILGPSGSGKSSLARAGLLPELARRALPWLEQPRVVVMTPGSTPLEALAIVLARVVENDPAPVSKTREFLSELKIPNDSKEFDGLRRITNALPRIDTSPLIILVDQFEEIYSLCKTPQKQEERQIFIENLLQAAATPEKRVSVIITLRSDFLEETQQHSQLNQVIASDQSVIVPMMTVEELRRAIAEPAKWAGHPFDEAVVELLVEQSKGREGALPLLQLALTQIWDGIEKGQSSEETLMSIGGVGGALATVAQRIYDKLEPEEKDIARRIFINLIELGEESRDTRRRVNLSSLITTNDSPEQVQSVLNYFSFPSARLITLSTIGGEEIVEVTHEVLFENWQLIDEWTRNRRDLIRQQRAIEEPAREWAKQKKKRGYLLQGQQLSNAARFKKRHQDTLPLSRLAEEYLLKSLRKRRINRLYLSGFAIIPILVVDSYFRERNIQQYYDTISTGNPENGMLAEERRAVQLLTMGCPKISRLPNWTYFIAEKIAGNCRSLDNQDGLRGAQLQELNLTGVNFRGADLSDANLTRAILDRTDLREANLEVAVLLDANLKGANLNQARLVGANLQSADFIASNLSNTNLKGADLFRANFKDSVLDNVNNLQTANLCMVNFENVSFGTSSLANIDFRCVGSLVGSIFPLSVLHNANFSEVDLQGVDFADAEIQGANFTDADLREATFSATKFAYTKFDNAFLEGADLSSAFDLKPEQIETAYLCETQLPSYIGMTVNEDKDCN